jgi:hypothetical protein
METTLYIVEHYRAPEITTGSYTKPEVYEIFKKQKKDKFNNRRYFKTHKEALDFLRIQAKSKVKGAEKHLKNMQKFLKQVEKIENV